MTAKNGLIQVVADNFDTQIFPQNGQKSTHGLAMILTQAGQARQDQTLGKSESTTTKRLKQEETKADKLTL